MEKEHPYPAQDGVQGIGMAILLTLVTCGIYGLFWQYKQIKTLNAWLRKEEFSFPTWFFLTILTCGLFSVYYEYKMAGGINEIQANNELKVKSDLAVISLLLAVIGLGIVSMAIQQAEINGFYGDNPDL